MKQIFKPIPWSGPLRLLLAYTNKQVASLEPSSAEHPGCWRRHDILWDEILMTSCNGSTKCNMGTPCPHPNSFAE